ncbi:crotonobetaine/carnitine-CoA ligase [Bradyrhizobium sp. IAR9]|uniref:class I adenylate-forming enzyme family protein n=1 Tax=Bradyrhizobium sp. IAR9 TaxID=2663841 RepID=UPI0015CE677D|nr:AMP-binding protein [Bradyrhizobium sp. IAR9]NYG45380.1 crotonobetaine/carnitine-CoA ligase [Bradyrhizobium sp. IAR9]
MQVSAPLQTLSELIQSRATDSADRVFCSFKGKNTTFAQFEGRVKEFAGALIEAGLNPGDRVGLMIGQSIDHVEMFCAVVWVGAIPVPFSVHLKSAGLELQLNSARPKLFIADRVYANIVRQAVLISREPPKIVWLEDGIVLAGEAQLNWLLRSSRSLHKACPRSLDDPHVIMYTSGTTGAPKGAVQSERCFAVGAKNAGILNDAQRDDVFHSWEPFYNGSAWIVVTLALQKGLKLHMVERFSASRLWDEIQQAGATKLHYLGGLINIILAQPVVESEHNNSVRIAWGAACPVDSWRKFEKRFQLKVREGYGSTEGQMFTHLNLEGVVGSVGKPIEEMESWIVDECGGRVGPGVTGELVLKPRPRAVSMLEYWGEPEKTAEVVRDGCIFSGDYAMVDESGNYFFKGRKKDSLRRRGQNVSAWEVERIINAAPGVEESAVVGVDSELGDQEIVAVVKMRDGAPRDSLTLLKCCADQLAYYQVPRYYQFVEDFPRGPSQRILKRDIQVDLANAWDAEKAGVKPTRANQGRQK